MPRSSGIPFLLLGILLAILGTGLVAEALYVLGRYDGCTSAPGGPYNSNQCTINGSVGIGAGGPGGNAIVIVELAVFCVLLALGLGLTIVGAYKWGRPGGSIFGPSKSS